MAGPGSGGVEDDPALVWAAEIDLSTEAAIAALTKAELEIEGRLTDASNATLYCGLAGVQMLGDAEATGGADSQAAGLHAVYKPIRGERPLDDFPDRTLAYREVSAWHVSQATGWGVVPPTVLRDGPAGMGAVQLWIEVDDEADVLQMILTRDARLRQVALLDAILNNADRKGGHLLPTAAGRVHGCDHGVCFAVEPKLRTVLWGWRGEPLTGDEVAVLERVRDGLNGSLGRTLGELLAAREVDATCQRVDTLLREKRMPVPDPFRHVIPWPPF